MTKDSTLRVAIKVPGKVQDVGKALKRLGGIPKIVSTVRQVHKKITKAVSMVRELELSEKGLQ